MLKTAVECVSSAKYFCFYVCFLSVALLVPIQSLLAKTIESCQGLLPRHRKDFWPRFLKLSVTPAIFEQWGVFGCIVLAFTVTFVLVFFFFSFLSLSFSLELRSVHTSVEIVDWVILNSYLELKEHDQPVNILIMK